MATGEGSVEQLHSATLDKLDITTSHSLCVCVATVIDYLSVVKVGVTRHQYPSDTKDNMYTVSVLTPPWLT